MKKFVVSSMVATVVLSMIGCGPKPTETVTTDTMAATETAADTSMADTTAAESAAGTAVSGEKYVINTDTTFTPFELESEKGEMVGINPDILRAIAQNQGFEYEVIPVGFPVACIALEPGECDGIIAGMSITDERIQKYDFFGPYYGFGVEMTVLSDSDITIYDQLRRRNVATRIDTEGYTSAESIADQYGFGVTQYENSSDTCRAALSSEAATCLKDYPVIGYEASRGLKLTFPTDVEKDSSYGFTALKGANPELANMFGEGLENTRTGGRYEEIPDTYIAK